MAKPCTQPDNNVRGQLMLQRLALLVTGFLFFSCGIEEYYYLPQLSENNISSDLYDAVIDFPLVSNEYYYAANYEIFYRIYASDYSTTATINPNDLSRISQFLASDYRSFEPITDPVDTSSITSTNTFINRNYFKLEFEGDKGEIIDIDDILSKEGGRLTIRFLAGTDFPAAYFDGMKVYLKRSSKLISPEPDRYFYNSLELRNYDKANVNINADVAGRSGSTSFVYVSMYIVLTGTNPVNFSTMYSKPTHISIFKLPDF
jgi:hypothetical protein